MGHGKQKSRKVLTPIDLKLYTARKLGYLRERGYSCLYVVAKSPAGPSKIGYATDPVARMSHLRTSDYRQTDMFYLLWTPGKPVSVYSEELIHEFLTNAGKLVQGEWFSVPVEWAARTVDTITAKAYPTVRFFRHEEMIKRLRAKLIDRVDYETLGVDVFRKSANIPANHSRSRILPQHGPWDHFPVSKQVNAERIASGFSPLPAPSWDDVYAVNRTTQEGKRAAGEVQARRNARKSKREKEGA